MNYFGKIMQSIRSMFLSHAHLGLHSLNNLLLVMSKQLDQM